MDSGNIKYDLRLEIPAHAFLNAQIIQEVRDKSEFKQAIKTVITTGHYKNQGLTEYEFQNTAYVVSLLYCLIVVPKELWGEKKKSDIYNEIEKEDVLKLFNIKSAEQSDKSAFSLIRHLRNAVSHADFNIDSNFSFTFRDDDSKWGATIGINDLMKFLSIAGRILANHGLNYREGILGFPYRRINCRTDRLERNPGSK